MEPSEVSDQTSSDCDEVLLLKKKLAETEDKLVKFKKFVVNLRNERTQLQEQVTFFEGTFVSLLWFVFFNLAGLW